MKELLGDAFTTKLERLGKEKAAEYLSDEPLQHMYFDPSVVSGGLRRIEPGRELGLYAGFNYHEYSFKDFVCAVTPPVLTDAYRSLRK